MDYYGVEKSLQVLIQQTIPLSRSYQQAIHAISLSVLLAGSSHLSRMARWLKRQVGQDSRIQWLRRTLGRDYLRQAYVYEWFVKRALSRYHAPHLHLTMDRSPLPDKTTDLLSLSLSFRNRAIPLVWEFMPHGMSGYDRHCRLIDRCYPLLPAGIPVIFHGDNEFGGVPLMQYLRHLGWDFIVGASSNTLYRVNGTQTLQRVDTLPVTKTRSAYLGPVEFTKSYGYGNVNLFGFYQPRFSTHHRKQDVRYYATSLPIARTLRRTGRHRWGIECCFKDFKSSGWQFQMSNLCHPERREGLMTVLSLAYLWTTCLGRWLCKTGQRSLVDAKTDRHLSLFRIGWDWLVYRYNMDLPCPTLLTLYQ